MAGRAHGARDEESVRRGEDDFRFVISTSVRDSVSRAGDSGGKEREVCRRFVYDHRGGVRALHWKRDSRRDQSLFGDRILQRCLTLPLRTIKADDPWCGKTRGG